MGLGVKTPTESSEFFSNCVVSKYTARALLLYSLILNFLQENVKIVH